MLLLSFLFLWEILLIDYSISINLHVTLESLKLGLQMIKYYLLCQHDYKFLEMRIEISVT